MTTTVVLNFKVEGLTCADCAMQLERAITQTPDVGSIAISVMTGTASVVTPAASAEALQALAEHLGSIAAPLGFTMTRSAAAEEASITLDLIGAVTAKASAEILRAVPGVHAVQILSGSHGTTGAVTVSYNPAVVGARALVASCGSGVLALCRHSRQDDRTTQHHSRLAFAIVLTVAAIVLQYGMPHGIGSYNTELYGLLTPQILVMWILATVAGAVFGAPLLKNAVAAAWYSRTMTMDTLVSISSGVAYVYATALVLTSWAGSSVQGLGEPPFETVVILLGLVALGREVEASSKRQTSKALNELSQLQHINPQLVEAAENVSPTACCASKGCAIAQPACLGQEQCTPCCADEPAMKQPDSSCCDGGQIVGGGSSCCERGGVAMTSAASAPASSTAPAGCCAEFSSGASSCNEIQAAVPVDAVLLEHVVNLSSCAPTSIAPELVHIGDVLAVGPSQRFPADAIVVRGTTSVDESMVTGESRPVLKDFGDAVIGGTTNVDGLVHVRVTSLPSMGTVARIISLIEGAQAQRPRLQGVADRIASWFTPFILASGVLTFVLWVAACATGHVDTGGLTAAPFALQFALSLIVVSCPCAIGLAVPTVIMVATSVAARLGLLLKSGATLEVLPEVRHIVFDKTGTLTRGLLTVSKVVVVDPSSASTLAERLGMRLPPTATSSDIAIAVAAAVAEGSSHPLSLSIVARAKELGLPASTSGCQSRTAVAGKGVRATLNGVELVLGSPSFVQDARTEEALTLAISAVPKEMSLVCVVADGALWAVIGFLDDVRPEAAAVLRRLAKLGVKTWIASGDRIETVLMLASALDIPVDRALGGLQPADKSSLITSLQKGGSRVAMVGDGVNDAVALTAADVGIAMGAGTAVAMDCADVVIKSADLSLLITLIDLAVAARTRILINFGWAGVYNIIAMPVAAGVLFPATGRVTIPPAFAGLSELFSSVPVVLGSLLLYRFSANTIGLAS